MSILTLQERLNQLGNNLPLMVDREKGDIETLIEKEITIRDYGFMKDEKEKEYIAFIIDENEKEFFFGGQVLTDNFMELEADGFRDAIQETGVKVLLGKKK